MKQWFLFGCVLLITGCGEKSMSDNSNKTYTELDGEPGGDITSPALGVNIEELKQSPMFREFDVDFFSSDPIEQAGTFTLSSNDTYKISLKTFDYLPEPRRISLVKASNIIDKGTPKVIAPLGYSVIVKVEGNEVIAEIQSTTDPKEPPKLAPIPIQNDDIIIGDVTSVHLQAAGVQNELSVSEVKLGLHSDFHGANRHLTYDSGQWIAQVSHQQIGKHILLNGQTGFKHTFKDMGTVSFSFHGIYRMQDAYSTTFLGVKYTCPYLEGVGQWNIMASSSVDARKSVAFGIGWTGKLWSDSKISVGVVKSNLEVSYSMLFTLNP